MKKATLNRAKFAPAFILFATKRRILCENRGEMANITANITANGAKIVAQGQKSTANGQTRRSAPTYGDMITDHRGNRIGGLLYPLPLCRRHLRH